MAINLEEEVDVLCYHCNDTCLDEQISHDAKDFCCHGCKTVYELFQETTELNDIYDRRLEFVQNSGQFDFLTNETIVDDLLDFKSDSHNRIGLFLPAIHCSSCIYLLENLHRLDAGVIKVTVNFVKKEADILYDPSKLTLEQLAELLASIGYGPNFTRSRSTSKKTNQKDDTLSIKIGVAAFCFGNIMLLSFPEYLGFDSILDEKYSIFFSWLNVILALPIALYSSVDYFRSAYKGLVKGFVNIDVPIAIGILVLFIRSTYEVLSLTGSGYFDSLAGLVFFLLIGRWFQSKTYQNLSFERDYMSYFPLAVLKLINDEEVSTPIDQLSEEDHVIIRNSEIIPADGVLKSATASIDYSFVTGESKPIKVHSGELVYAGGRQLGQRIELILTKKSSQSYLTDLWNSQVFKHTEDGYAKFLVNKVSKYFTAVVLSIAIGALIFWWLQDPTKMWQSFTAVLIVACPCALALSAPFTNGNVLRWLGKSSLYLKGADVVETLSEIDTIVFDKTGTLTDTSRSELTFEGQPLSDQEKHVIMSMTANSTHPLSQRIHSLFNGQNEEVELEHFEEIPGKGLLATHNLNEIRIGSAQWVGLTLNDNSGHVYLRFNDSIRGYFKFRNYYREGIEKLIQCLKRYELHVLSGDNSDELSQLEQIFGKEASLRFQQSPEDKMEYLSQLKENGKSVMMLGDGLNDAGALKQSNVGVAVTDDIASFTPACDGILLGTRLTKLDKYLQYAKVAKRIVIASFIISFTYNILGVAMAVSGLLTPVFAAILMPVSSISVVLFTTLTSNFFANKFKIG